MSSGERIFLILLAGALALGIAYFATRDPSPAGVSVGARPNPSGSTQPVSQFRYVVVDRANLRAEPSEKAKVVRTLPKNSEVVVHRTEGTWHLVHVPGHSGEAWISDTVVATADQVRARRSLEWCSMPAGREIEALVHRYDGEGAWLYGRWYSLPYEQKQTVLAWLGKCRGVYSAYDYQSGRRLGYYSDERGAVIK